MTEPPASAAERHEKYLSTAHLAKNLRRSSVRGGAAMVTSQTATFLISTAGTAVLARILEPKDFGLIAMVATFTRLIEQLKDMGLATATVQRREISHAQVSYLFWVNAAVGLGASLLTALSAPIVAWFYGEPQLTQVTIALSTAFLITGLGVQHQALQQRRLEYKVMASSRIAAMVIGTGLGIAAAWAGAGYWALVAMQLGQALALTALAWMTSPWRPGPGWRSAPEKRALIAFGSQITGARLLGFLTRNVDNVLIGKVWGDEALGLYAKAYQLLMLPVLRLINPLTGVVVPALSRLQHDPPAYIGYYQRALRTLSILSMPVVVICFVAAPELIGVVLGERWTGAVRIFQYLGPAAFAGALNPTAWAWISLNQADRLLRWNLITTPIILASFVAGIRFGPEGVAIAFSVAQTVLRYFGAAYCFRGNFLSMRILMQAVWQPTVASLGAGVLIWGLAYSLLPPLPMLVLLIVKSVAYGLAYLGIWLALPGGPSALKQTALLVKELRSKSKPPPPEQPA
jgi:O-antigen/teichoic acid export membrane protein